MLYIKNIKIENNLIKIKFTNNDYCILGVPELSIISTFVVELSRLAKKGKCPSTEWKPNKENK